MTDSQVTSTEPVVQKNTDQEFNFRKQEAIYKKMLEDERNARLELEKKYLEKSSLQEEKLDEEDDPEDPYVDHKRLDKKLAKFEKNIEKKIEQKAEQKAQMMIQQERRSMYLRENSDFNAVMNEETIQKFADAHPKLAENILHMPDGFERQKLVYETIKTLGIDKPKVKESSVQEKIDANRRNPYYQPSNVASGAYANQGDFSDVGQAAAYKRMQELKKRVGGRG
jgi:hypothetical protein